MKKLAAILLMLVVTQAGVSQHQPIRFEKIGQEQGLSSQQTTYIFRDHLGFIWIGTSFGLNRFDGIRCKTYYHDKNDSNSLVHNQVHTIAEDADHLLWIGTQEGVSCLDPITGKFINYSATAKSNYTFPKEHCFTYVDKTNTVWIGHKAGISFISDRSKSPVNIPVQLEPPGKTLNKFITSFLHDSNDRIWASTSYGILRVDKKNLTVTNYHTDKHQSPLVCLEIAEDSKGRIFTATWGQGILVFNEKLDLFVSYQLPQGLGPLVVRNIFPSTETGIDYLWLGTESGLVKIRTDDLLNSRNEFRKYEPNKLSSESISSLSIGRIIRDPSGIIWISTENGVNKVDVHNQTLQTFPLGEELPYKVWPSAVCDDLENPNRVWVGTGNNLFSYDKNKHEFFSFDRSSISGSFRDMIKGKEFYWITSDPGLVQLNARMQPVKTYRQGLRPADLNTDKLITLCEDHEGKLWIGTAKKGINILDPATGTIQKFLDGIHSPHLNAYVNKIIEDNYHNVWIGSTSGLMRYDRRKGVFEKFLTKNISGMDAFADNILSLKETKDGKIWVGSRQGLRYFSYTTNQFTDIAIPDLRMSDFISGILEDSLGKLWLATNNGLLRFDPRANNFKLYNITHGLPDNDLTFAFEQDASGMIYIGSAGGLTVFNPLSLVPNRYTAPPIITGITVDNTSTVPSEKKLRLRHDQSIGFNFVSLNYTNPENNKYAYQLKGYKEEWINIDNRRDIFFPGLPPGNYTLRLKAANNDGIWDEQITELNFLITPPFWKTWWFISLVVLLVGAGIYLIYRYRVNQLLRIEKMRTRIATDLHDDIGATLSSISFYSEAVKQKSKEKLPELTPTLEKMGETSRTMVTSMSDIVWAINPQNDDIEKMLLRMQSYAADLCAVKNVLFHMKAGEEVRSLKPRLEQRKNIYLVFKEALNNALKYAQSDNIWLTIKQEGNRFTMQIRDDGKGFDSTNELAGNGLQNMKRRADEIDGGLTITAGVGQGTSVELMVKIT